MKRNKLWSLLLVFAFSFSIAHEYVYTLIDEEHCTVQEYVHELSASSDHGDICDIHHQYHHLFVLDINIPSSIDLSKMMDTFSYQDKKLSPIIQQPYRPPCI